MLLIYLVENLIFIILGSYLFRRKMNPFTIFIIPWILMVILYDLKLVTYNNLTSTTYIVLILTSFVYCLASMVGYLVNNNNLYRKVNKRTISVSFLKSKLKRLIMILSFLGIIPGIVSLIDIFKIYGLDFYTKLSTIYGERVLGKVEITTIPYMTSLLFIAITLSGIYFSKYGFDLFILFPIVSICIQPFTNGGRQFLAEGILLFLLPSIIGRGKKMSNKWKYAMCFLMLAMILLMLVISNQRSAYVNNIQYVSYATPNFEKLMADLPGIYQLYTYISSPVGVLNAFLDSPDFSFGVNSLFPFYGLINRFGANVPVQRYQPFYYIPIQQNAGTAIKELMEDYHLAFALLIVLICGFFVGRTYKKYEDNKSFSNIYTLTQVFTLVILSFFSWMLRDANLILALVLGILITKYLDKYSVIGDEKNNG